MKLRINKRVSLTAILFSLVALAHLPISLYPHIFDKNQAPQFLFLLIAATAFGGFILRRINSFLIHKNVLYTVYALLVLVLISTLFSGSIISSLTGDTGRYAGAIGLFALLIVSLFHTNFTFENLITLIKLYLIPVVIQALLGIMQFYKLIDFPGASGVAATMGNPDFFAAFVGISAPLFVLAAYKSATRNRIIFGIGFAISLYSLYLAGALQAYVDIAITLLGLIVIKFRKKIPTLNWSLNAKTALGALIAVIWTEFIFLIPFLGKKIPVLGTDAQVKVRANFWLAATRQFTSHPVFGVGPDQYGNYYEEFRTKQDIREFSQILSNDAHSASVQTLATLGVFGALGFLALIVLALRSILLIVERNPVQRVEIYLIGLFIVVYLTNSFVSPMVYPAKYLLWAIGGWVIGQVYRSGDLPSINLLRAPLVILLALIVFIGAGFGLAYFKYSSTFENFAHNQKAKFNYNYNQFMPCFMYLEGTFQINGHNNIATIEQIAKDQIKTNPRCVSAHIALAQIYTANKDYKKLKPEIYTLMNIAKSRGQVINLAIEYVKATGDQKLVGKISKIMSELNLVYVPGKSS